LINARGFPEAVSQAEYVLELSPDSVFLKWELGNAKVAMGDYDGAVDVNLSRKVGSPGTNFMVGVAHALSGREQEARQVLDFLLERRQKRYVPASQIGVIYGALGELDEAFEWLDRAFEEQDWFLYWLKVDPTYDPLRNDPRFDPLLERMDFPQ
jgi:tetratricopeptide (TPR) repeat protein